MGTSGKQEGNDKGRESGREGGSEVSDVRRSTDLGVLLSMLDDLCQWPDMCLVPLHPLWQLP